GLAPINPLVLRRQGFAPLIAALRANMRHAGILRIDHVMGLQRLYWIPDGSPATNGAYVSYPFHDLLRVVALESRRECCAVVGEGLLPRERFAEFLATDETPNYTAELGDAIHVFLARSRARLMLVQLEDVTGESEQANLPGTTDGHPNWRRRLSLRLEDILAGPDLVRLAGSVNAARRQARPETLRE